jgi:perosamine synthetase
MKNSICRNNVSLRTALAHINADPAGIAFLEDEQGVLKGVVTDGDIRRMLLDGVLLEDSVEGKYHTDFVYAIEGTDIKDLLAKTNKKVRLIPIVNQEKKLVDYFRYDARNNFIPVAIPELDGNEFAYLQDAFLSTWISSTGAYINRFETDFSSFCGVKHAIAVSNGTVAISLILKAMNIGPGDEVIVPDLTFAATINTVIHAGATPVIVDVEKEYFCIDPKEIEKAITPKTKAIIPVHLYGQCADMEVIMSIAEKHNLYVIEDAAEAHGASQNGKKVGSMGHAASFSFYGNKIITTGEGGMVTTNSDELNEKMRILRDHGMSKEKRYWQEEVGFNFRMTNLQAAIGCAQLEKIDEIIENRKRLEKKYGDLLCDKGFKFMKNRPNSDRVVWLVSVLYEGNRDQLLDDMKKNRIDGRPFFYPLSDMPVYKKYAKNNPVSRELSKKGLNLPTVKDINFDMIDGFFKEYTQ